MSVNTDKPEKKRAAWATMDWPGYILFLLLSLGLLYYVLSPTSGLGFNTVPALWDDGSAARAEAAKKAAEEAAAAEAAAKAEAEAAAAAQAEADAAAAAEAAAAEARAKAEAEAAAAQAEAEAAAKAEAEAQAAAAAAATQETAAFDGSLPTGVKLDFAPGGVEDQLVSFIRDDSKAVDKKIWFDFDRLTFKTGSAELTDDSSAQLQNIYEIMKAYPDVNLKIGGYTDNTGNPDTNLQLSLSRAQTVQASLIALGIENDRLDSEGYGIKHPIASNDTAEGRAKNRRVSVSVRAK
ncbi:MAG: OmpA family protein [Pseudomonadota bacterium]